MVMNASTVAQFDTIRELAFGGITSTYAPIGTPLGHYVRILTIKNYTDEPVSFSDDGVNHKLKYYPGGGQVWGMMGNKSGYSESFSEPWGTQWYARIASGGTNPTSGSVIIESVHGKGE